MKLTFPLIIPTSVLLMRAALLAMPKSDNFTSPRIETRTLPGATSRWTIPNVFPSASARPCA
jgi:hypothetical protein